jgi:DNA ligase-1|tara:strand:- start:526 stop:1818 length:1293 start_codon:yes stop_codon:yes gene_type:complete
MTDLQLIYDFVEQSNSTNSNTDKLNVLKTYTQYDSVKKALLYTYDTYKQYGVTSKNCKKNSDLMGHPNTYGDFFGLLDDLNNRVCTGHAAIANVNRFVQENKNYEDLIWNIIDRNLKTRSTTSMINKVVPGLIPTFDVALANAYNDKTSKKVDWNDNWYVSRKLDGVRCLTVIDGTGNINFFSRAGKPFLTLDSLKPSIQKLGLTNMILDGEICMTDKDGNEDFQGIIKEIKRKDHTIENPVYFMFDLLTQKEFDDKISVTLLSERLIFLRSYVLGGDKFIKVLDQKLGSDNHLENMMEISKNEGWEGLMLRKDDTYQGKRSNDILKVKKFFDEEYVVIDLENAINRVIVNGKEVEELMLKNAVIEHKGNRVQVGSGFSHEQKRYFFKNPNQILGKTITVQYFEETTDQNGEHSLRFPVMKGIYEGERTF